MKLFSFYIKLAYQKHQKSSKAKRMETSNQIKKRNEAPFKTLFIEKDNTEKKAEIVAWLAQMIEKSDLPGLPELPEEVIENILRFVPCIRTDAVIINDWVIVDVPLTYKDDSDNRDFRVYPLSDFRKWEEEIDEQIKLGLNPDERDTVFGRVRELQDRTSRSKKVNNLIMIDLHSGNHTVKSILEMTAEELKELEELEYEIDNFQLICWKHADGTGGSSTWPKQAPPLYRCRSFGFL